MPDNTIEVGGREVKVYKISPNVDPNEVVLNMVAFGRIGETEATLPGSMVAKATEQIETTDQFQALVIGGACESPPVRIDYYDELYRRSAMHKACVETKVADIAGLGYRIRPRAELFPRQMDLQKLEEPDPSQQRQIEDFLDLAMVDGQDTFTDIICQQVRDRETSGQGYVEFSRNNAGKIDGIYLVKGETIRIARGGPKNGFWHNRGGKWRYFAPYTGEKGVKVAQIKGQVDKSSIVVPAGAAWSVGSGYDVAKLSYNFVGKADGSAETIRANELMMWKKGTPKDTYYGEPDIHAAIEDYLIAQGVRLFVVSYFDNGAVPRMILTISGDSEISKKTLTELTDFLSNKERFDALNQTVLLQLPEGCTMSDTKLVDVQLNDNTAMSDLRDRSEYYISLVHRVPLSAIPGRVGSQTMNRAEADEANRRYVGSVVRPSQRGIEDRWNFVFKKELGITEWVLDLEIPDLLDMKTKHEIWEVGVRQGWYTLNEVRAALNLKPIKGGDIPILRIPGQGAVPVSDVSEIAVRIRDGAKVNDLMATGNTKTPPKGVGAPISSKALAFQSLHDDDKPAAFVVMDDGGVPQMPRDEAEQVAKALEELAVNKDDAASVVGISADTP